MKQISPELKAIFETRQFLIADLYTITLADGLTVLRYCSGDADIVANGHTFSAGGQTGPYFEVKDGNGPLAHWKAGLEVDKLTLSIIAGDATVVGIRWNLAVWLGLFDNAEVVVDRAYMTTYGNVSAGTVNIFSGIVGEVDYVGSIMTMMVESYLVLLDQELPRNLFEVSCSNTLFDSVCSLNPDNFRGETVTTTGSSTHTIVTGTAGSPPAGYFVRGVLEFIDGPNAGFRRMVIGYVPGTYEVSPQFPYAPGAGERFNVWAGCDKAQSTCTNKFNNLANFRGFPFIPIPETAV